MENINNYTVIQSLKILNDNISLWLCENSTGAYFEILTIAKYEKYERTLQRLKQSEIKPLINETIDGIQSIIEIGFDNENDYHFIVYEHLEYYCDLMSNQAFASVLHIIEITKALDYLKKGNHTNYFITPENIFINTNGQAKLKYVGLFELFKKEDLLNPLFLAPNVQKWLSDNKQNRPNHQDDIYSLIKSFEFLLRNTEHKNAIQILEKSLCKKRIERFGKYHELLELLESLPKSKNYTSRETIKVMTNTVQEKFQPILEEMNEQVWLLVEDRLSKGKEQITGRFTTKNWNGRFFLDDKNHLFIPFKEEYNSFSNRVKNDSNSFLADFDFNFNHFGEFDCRPFFKEKFDTRNQLAELSKSKKDWVKQWKTLPEKEKEYIEEKAFKTKFHTAEDVNGNVRFHLQNIAKGGWKKIKNLKREEVILYIDDQRIGKILNYSSQNKTLTLKDIKCNIDEIPKEGELIEDVQQETSQYKKQVEACQKFEKSDVVNPELCSILATPNTAIPNTTRLYEEDYENFKDKVFNFYLKNDESQMSAVLEALNQKPVYLIQGPPGTGKTTVIIELIQQLIEHQRDVKILVVSQSNMAVDNVLEKLDKINQEIKKNGQNHLGFMRLASQFTIAKDNVSKQIVPHTFEAKLKNWAVKTKEKSTQFLTQQFTQQTKQKDLISFYDFYVRLNKKTDWEDFQSRLRISSNYLKRIFEYANDFQMAKSIFNKKLGADFTALQTLQKDWFSFLDNITVEDENDKNRKKSMLNNGSTEIDFLTAMMQDLNVIGATCIHIASSQYSRVNFKFDYIIMDESSKASPAETLVPINMAKNIILIGDHKQLPPVVTRENAVKKKVKQDLDDNGLDFDKTFSVSLFEQLIKAFEADENKEQFIRMLDIQYRMPKQIGSLISKYFYDGKLKNPSIKLLPDYEADKKHNLLLKKDTSILFLSTSNRKNPQDNGDKHKRQNKCNVETIQELLTQLNEQYTDNLQKEKPFTIGIIAGYRGQVELLQKSINISEYSNFVQTTTDEDGIETKTSLIEINTVDKFQGAERDIIIYDVVRSSIGQSNIGFLDDYRRINVAFSRVKRLLFVVGDSEYLIKRATLNPQSKFKDFKLQQIAQELNEQGLIINNLKEILR